MRLASRPHTGRQIDWTFIAVTITAVLTAAAPFLARSAKLAYYQDDFFYYLQVARNLAEHHLSTFDGTTLTNGYHPLWLLVLTAAWLPGNGQLVFPAVALIVILGGAMTYRSTNSLLSRIAVDSSVAALGATWITLFYLSLARTGMEVILTVPLGLMFLGYTYDGNYLKQPSGILRAGLLASVLVLSRLDAMLLVLLYGILLLISEPSARRFKQALWFAAGMAPLYLYLLSNIIFFGTLDTVSSKAKHLQNGLHLDSTAVHTLFSPFGLVAVAFLLPAFALLPIAGIAQVRRRRNWTDPTASLIGAALIFPILYFGILSVISDWRLWPWYRYPLVISSTAALLVLCHPKGSTEDSCAKSETKPALRLAMHICSFTLCVAFVLALKKPPQDGDIYAIAVRLQQFARLHPGRYAMGDAAGTAAFLLGQPVVQLEGLMMDKSFLENIREQRNLLDVLHDYRVRYYVAINAVQHDGCRTVVEPREGGRHSPHMTAKLCRPPAEEFYAGQYLVSVFDLGEATHRQ
jgi:hypothetical protein